MDVGLQVTGAALRSIAQEMGAVLIRSAFSANIKERRDCSTAIFDERELPWVVPALDGHDAKGPEHLGVDDLDRRCGIERVERPLGGGSVELPQAPEPLHVEGPTVLELDGATCFVAPGWVGDRDGNSTLVLTRA